MPFLQWVTRCIPGISIILLFILLEWALGIVQSTFLSIFYLYAPSPLTELSVGQMLFICYTLLLHILGFVFPIRLSWAVWNATRRIRSTHEAPKGTIRPDSLFKSNGTMHETLNVTMVIIIPSYKETLETMQDTLKVLASHERAKIAYDVFLAMEERDPLAEDNALQLVEQFKTKFSDIQWTLHPAGIPGESAGKSSNVSWAAKEVEQKYSRSAHSKDVLITVMDSDTYLMSHYFDLLEQRHILNRQRDRMSSMCLYVPPIVFDRNAHMVPRLVRMADFMWCGAGLSCFQAKHSSTTVAIPTAVYTISFPLMQLANGWDTGPNAIGEDMHMALKVFFATKGQLRTESIPSPASQCNITTNTRGIRGWTDNHVARYKQGLRHMWGCMDTGYAVNQWCRMVATLRASSSRTSAAHSNTIRCRPRKSTDTDLTLPLNQHDLPESIPRWFTVRIATVFLRLFEAHFLPTHLFLVVVASALYTSLAVPQTDGSSTLMKVLEITAYLRALGFAAMTIYFIIFYEQYHHVCVTARAKEMKRAGLYDDLSTQFSFRGRSTSTKRFFNFVNLDSVLDCAVFPISGTIFGSIALIQAAFSHFFTEHLVYLVSAKPSRIVLLDSEAQSQPSLILLDNDPLPDSGYNSA